MSDLTTGGINFDYQSPIHQIVEDISTQIIQDGENQIFQAIQKSNIVVEKDELIKALQYDRNQYDKGYADGRASVVEELEKIKADFVEQRKDFGLTKNDSDYDLGSFDSYNYAITTIDYRIAELKGESNE